MRSGGLRTGQIIWIVIITMLVTAGVTYWLVRTYIYAKDFTPVELSAQERHELDAKLRVLGYTPDSVQAAEPDAAGRESDEQWLRPEAYSEAGARREVSFSERELNGMIAKNRDLAKKVAVDLGDDLVSARILVPVDPDFPVLGGKTLRLSTGVEMAFRDAKPVIVLKGVSVMGIPVPNAWLGGWKNVDLINEFGDSDGFWQSFADGVDNIRVEQGSLKIELRE